MSEKIRCKEIIVIGGTSEEIGFGLFDSKGRELGAHVYVGLRKYEPATIEERGYHWMVPGEYYVWGANQTRGGEHFGASQPMRVRTTLQECEQEIAKYLKAARRRCEKKFGGAA